jgi:hypothetical protein
MYIPNSNHYSLGYYETTVEVTKAIRPKLKVFLEILKTKAGLKSKKNVSKNSNAYC